MAVHSHTLHFVTHRYKVVVENYRPSAGEFDPSLGSHGKNVLFRRGKLLLYVAAGM